MLGSIADVADLFKGIFDGFSGAGSDAFDSIFDAATGSLGDN